MEVLRNMKERLKPGGLLYVAVKGIKEDGVEEEIRTEDDYGYKYERFFSYYTLDELKRYFHELDLEIVWELNARPEINWIQIIGRLVV